jgi:hypothetical protein
VNFYRLAPKIQRGGAGVHAEISARASANPRKVLNASRAAQRTGAPFVQVLPRAAPAYENWLRSICVAVSARLIKTGLKLYIPSLVPPFILVTKSDPQILPHLLVGASISQNEFELELSVQD